ncbi:phenylacetate--CoA ligase family protein [Vibrio spartinae]|uniref:Phenylacetate-coenzyme A ligase n=1 Tax=Vibrio spartinae TaxID=1918945 RepID=A0ABX6QUP1_9VIBR|nr:phenylacetate--CoA ligase family protein [Vibrio spartinae]QMV12963.1 Phenylacetate-coenzyme A ligase [Vibrio spartinae]
MIKRDSCILKSLDFGFSHFPLNIVKGFSSAFIAYPIAEKLEKREVRNKVSELKRYYSLPFDERKQLCQKKLYDTLCYAKHNVPYYKDLFHSINFEPDKIRKDINYIQEVPFLTKDIIREQGERLLSVPLNQIRHHECKTGGSTGLSCFIYYDQSAADYSAAVTLFSRDSVGNKKYNSELHFACQFPGEVQPDWPVREDFKCFAMNRSNIFFSSLDDVGLANILKTLQLKKPHLIHAHPSTIYALACYVDRIYGKKRLFSIFESSGELLEPYMKEKIESVLCCDVINRYGLAELGVMAYQYQKRADMFVYDSEGYPENLKQVNGDSELIFTGFRNRLMPLIRYKTGDLARVESRKDGFYLTNVVGRIHDVVCLNGIEYPTHHIQDVLDHRVGGIQEFQIDVRTKLPILRLVLEADMTQEIVLSKIEYYWPEVFQVKFVRHDDFIRVGNRAKFRHVVEK